MTYQAALDLATDSDEPMIFTRAAWPDGNVAAFDGDGFEHRLADGELTFLTDEDKAADDWTSMPA